MVADPPVADPAFQLTMPPYRPTPSDNEIERAAAKLRAAKRVAIVAGAGAAASGAGKELLALGEALAAPIATSLGAVARFRRGIVCRLVVPATMPRPRPTRSCTRRTWCVFVGCHTGDQVTHTWRIPPIDTAVVQIDIDPLELGRSYPNTLGLMGDPKATLAKLIDGVGQAGARQRVR